MIIIFFFQQSKLRNWVPKHRPIRRTGQRHITPLLRTDKMRSGVVAIMMVLVLGGLALGLLTLAGQTSIRMKSIQRELLESNQCQELLALGEPIVKARLRADADYAGEVLQLDLPWPQTGSSAKMVYRGHIAITRLAKSDQKGEWKISATCGWNEPTQRQATKTITLTTSRAGNPNDATR
jgi:hypothetical protein